MAVVSILDAFGYKWAQTGTVEALTDDQWKAGWAFIGALPPSVEQFNKWGQVSDEKSNYLYAQMKAVFDAAGEVPDAADINSLRDAMLGLVGGGRLLRTTIYKKIAGVQNVSVDGSAFTTTGAGTFTQMAGAGFKLIEGWGAGGGSGGNPVTSASEQAFSTGGGGGSYGLRRETGAMAGVVVTVGSAGAAGGAGTAGGSGGATSVGALLTCPGGSGSPAGVANGGVSNSGLTNGGGAPTGANMIAYLGGDAGQVVSSGLGFLGAAFGGVSGTGTPKSFGSGAPGKYNGVSTATPQPGIAAPEGGLIIIREFA